MATPTFYCDYSALIDHISGVEGAATQIATGEYDWGVGTKSNIVAGSGVRWPARAGVWTDPNNWTVVVVAKPDDVKSGELSQVFTLQDAGGSALLISFFGDYGSGGSGIDAFAAVHNKSGSFRRGGFANDVCDGNAHVWIARRSGASFQMWRDDVGALTTTTLTVNTAKISGDITASLHCTGTYGYNTYINRQAPTGMVKFYNEALSDADVTSLLADPWETGGATDAAATGATITGTATLTAGSATGGAVLDATATGATITGTSSLTAGSASGVVSGAFTSSPMYSSGILQASVSLDWTWYPGVIGTAPTSALVNGSGSTSAAGTLTASGLPTGDGFLLAETAAGAIYYEAGTVV